MKVLHAHWQFPPQYGEEEIYNPGVGQARAWHGAEAGTINFGSSDPMGSLLHDKNRLVGTAYVTLVVVLDEDDVNKISVSGVQYLPDTYRREGWKIEVGGKQFKLSSDDHIGDAVSDGFRGRCNFARPRPGVWRITLNHGRRLEGSAELLHPLD